MSITHNKYDPLGYVASFFLCMILIPQLIHIYRKKKSDQVSLYFCILSIITSILFLTFGIFLNSLPMILANCIVTLQNIVLIALKLKYKNN